MSRADRFLRACRNEPVDATPIWLMRQAGRYMAEYRTLREKYSILEMIQTPELATEVTLQPINAFELDAAIIFADILPLLSGMGLSLEFVNGEGPVIHNPLRAPADIQALTVRPTDETLSFTLDAIRMTSRELDGKVPLLGFSGAPFTLASYAIEGGSSKHYQHAKGLMYQRPELWHILMDKLSTVIADYLVAQVEAGAEGVQLFDSWVGALSPTDYTRYVLPYNRRIITQVQSATDVPVINFSTGTSSMLHVVASAGGDVISLDWRVDISTARDIIGNTTPIQGNLDPLVLATAPISVIEREATRILDSMAGQTGHIFNLGHGILKYTPVESVAALVDIVHRYQR